MQRLLATFLIALVGVMALMPQALCPCAQRARAEAAAVAEGKVLAAAPACCERCLARIRASVRASAQALTNQTPAPPDSAAQDGAAQDGDAPRTCPCCEMNGKGKNLLQPGQSVRAPELALTGFAFDLEAAATVRGLALARASADAVDDAPDEAPPAITRAGVVLLI